MTKIERDLRQKRAALLDGAMTVVRSAETANRELTPEELTDVTAKRAGAAGLMTQIEAVAGVESDAASVTRGVSVHDNRQDEPFRNIGEQLVAVARSTGSNATVDPRLLGIMERAASGAAGTVPSDGGFLVQTDFNAELLKKAHMAGQLAQRVRSFPISANANGMKINAVDESSRVTGSRWGGVQVYWAAEAGTTTAKKPKFRQISMDLQKLFGLFYATDELIQDAAALGSVAEQAFTEEFGFTFDDAIFRGDGAGKPLGFLNSPAVVSVAKETSQTAATIVTANVLKMWSRLPARSQQNAVWLYNVDAFPQFPTLNIPVSTAGGALVFMPAGGLTGSQYSTLLGRPMIACEQCETVGTVGDLALVDLSEYLWIEKGGVQAASSIHVQFLTDETCFRWTVRVNGQPGWDKALTPYKGSNTQSPFVTLATRS